MTVALYFILGVALGVAIDLTVARRAARRPAGAAPAPAHQRRWGRWVAAGLAVLLVVVPVAGYAYANAKFSKIPRIAVGSHLQGGGNGTNYLLVGSDSRPGVAGNRSDTIMLLHIDSHGAKTMSIPRDLYVNIASKNYQAKINAAHNDGPAELVDTIRQNLNLPIDRYIEINYTSFAGVVDALGGVTINFPYPASDSHSGLYIPQSGDVKLNGAQALAYVRSRYYTEVIPGRGSVTDGTADLGRIKRQQAFLKAVMAQAGHSKNPFTLMKVADAVAKGLRIDDKMTLWNALHFAWDMGGLQPTSVTLPTTPETLRSGEEILRLKDAQAAPILDQFR